MSADQSKAVLKQVFVPGFAALEVYFKSLVLVVEGACYRGLDTKDAFIVIHTFQPDVPVASAAPFADPDHTIARLLLPAL